MKIYAYLLDGRPITDYASYQAHGIPSGTDLLMISANSDRTPKGYTDVTSIPMWEKLFDEQLVDKDYKFIRQGIAAQVATSGWAELPAKEKNIASKWFVVEAGKRSEIHTMDEQVRQGIHFHNCSVQAREARFKAASAEVYNRLTREQQTVIVGEVESAALPKMYIQYGIEGTLEGDIPGLFDYLQGRPDTPYASSGLLQKEFVPVGMSMEHLVDRVMSILSSGMYDYSQFMV